jgi:hypothetical protein
MSRCCLLLNGTSGVREGGVSRLDRRNDRKTGPPALDPQVDLSVGCLVVALEQGGALEGGTFPAKDYSGKQVLSPELLKKKMVAEEKDKQDKAHP